MIVSFLKPSHSSKTEGETVREFLRRNNISLEGAIQLMEKQWGPAQGFSPKNFILATTSAQLITILIELYKSENGKIAQITALIDSRATICCINHYLVQRMKWPLEKLLEPMYTWNADRTNNTGGMIHHQVHLSL